MHWTGKGEEAPTALPRGRTSINAALPSSVMGGGAEKSPEALLLPSLFPGELSLARGFPAHKGQERRVKEDSETRPPAERLDEINIQRAGRRSPLRGSLRPRP